MGNKRILKKQIHYICGDIALECSMALDEIPGIDEKIIKECIIDLAELQTVTLNRITFSFDKASKDYQNKAEYFKEKTAYNKKAFEKLRIEFNKGILQIVDKMNSALPKSKEK